MAQPTGLGQDQYEEARVYEALFREAPDVQTLGRYVVLDLLGQGGMGTVLRAYDRELDRTIALKVLHEGLGVEHTQRLRREAQAMAKLSHPNVVQVYEVGEVEGKLFVAMELVKGKTVREWMQQRPRPGWRSCVELFVQLGAGLAAAHEKGLVHRDFKPGNAIVDDKGRARVLDFGLARGNDELDEGLDPRSERARTDSYASVPLETSLTVTGAVLGTPAYMPPEQMTGQVADARSDQFSLCVSLYEAVYGERPYEGGSMAALMVSMLHGSVRPAPKGSKVPLRLRNVLLRGLSVAPEERWPSMEALLELLERDPERERRRWLKALGLVVTVAIVVTALVLGGLALRERQLERRRQAEAMAELERVEIEIEQAKAEGDTARAVRLFDGFVTRPQLQDTEAIVHAWLGEAARRRSDRAFEAAQSAYARAYLRSESPRLQAQALRGLAELFHREQNWNALDRVLGIIEARHPDTLDALVDLRTDAALISRELDTAQALLDDADPRRPTLRILAEATATDLVDPTWIRPFDLEGDGVDELMVYLHLKQRVVVVRAKPGLPEVASYALATRDSVQPLSFGRGRPGLLVTKVDQAQELRLSSLYPAHRELLRWSDEHTMSGVTADLDGDGEAEAYVGTGPYTRHIVELREDTSGAEERWSWRLPERKREAARSDLTGLAAADLDGDGTVELIAGAGPWSAYDVRVLRSSGDQLVLVDRMQLGEISEITMMRGAKGDPLIVAATAPNTTVLSPRRYDALGTIHLLRFRDDRLERVAEIPLPHAEVRTHVCCHLNVGDIDGDDLDDLAVGFRREDGGFTMVLSQTADGEFTSLLLGGITPYVFADIDGDRRDELLTGIHRHTAGGREYVPAEVWVLGAGDDALPTFERDATASSFVQGQEFLARWGLEDTRAADLEVMSLEVDAAKAFEDEPVTDESVRGAALLHAAELHERAGNGVRALELFERLREDPIHGRAALRGLIRGAMRLAAHEEALKAIDAMLELGELDELERARMSGLREQLTAATMGEERIELRFDRPLDDALEVVHPLGVRHDRATGTLELNNMVSGELASLPLTWSGGHIMVEIDWEIERAEWGTQVELDLVPEGRQESETQVIRFSAEARGGGGSVGPLNSCDVGHWTEFHRKYGGRGRERLRASFTPALGERRCVRLDEHGEPLDSHWALLPLDREPGAYRLRLVAKGGFSGSWSTVRVHEIRVIGARLRTAARAHQDVTQAANHAFVDGRWAEVLDHLGPREDRTTTQQAMAVESLLGLGRIADGKIELAALIERLRADDPTGARPLHVLLRRSPQRYQILLSEQLGADAAPWIHKAWDVALAQHIEDPQVGRELLGMTLNPSMLGDDPAIPTLEAFIALLGGRARVLAHSGDPESARQDLITVLALIEDLPGPAAARSDTELKLATIEVQLGEHEAARARVQRLLADDQASIYLEDRVRASPPLAPLLAR